ncbi:MAG: hypothetical protein IAF94_11260, partial [Pirellulaceae bacterium]|nr:hypothetical protein [Pirellulaceae bacterium]
MPFLAVALAAALIPPGIMWPGEPHSYDVVEYHLQIPREWWEAGQIIPLYHNVFSFFPFNVEMHYLLAMHLLGGPWAGMFLAQFMHLSFVVLTVIAIHGFAREIAPGAAAHLAGVAAATVPWLAQLSSIAYNEGGLLLFGTLAIGWAFRAVMEPSRRLGRFPVAGLLAGFACGSKLTGVPEVLVAVAICCVIGIIATRKKLPALFSLSRVPAGEGRGGGWSGPHPNPPPAYRERGQAEQPVAVPLGYRLAGVAIFVAAGLLTFSPWLIRNQIWAGNPVFPEAPSLGQGHFSDAQVERWKAAHAPRSDQQSAAGRARAWRQEVWTSWQYGYVLLPLGLLAGAFAFRRGTPAMLIGMYLILSIVWICFTHLQSRFFILAIPITALMLAYIPRGKFLVGGIVVVLAGAAVLG